jgi:hypothetical protein
MKSAVPEPNKPRRFAFDLRGTIAIFIYFTAAALFLARGIFGQFSPAYIGQGGDPPMLMWEMAWWLHAIRHGLNPLYTNALWAPQGVNLTWTPNMPLISIPAMPLIAIAGPVFSYNLFCLLAVTAAAWCAFILCRYATGAYWAALVGGYVFGFSAYMMAHASADLNLILIFPSPLLALLLLRAMREEIGASSLIASLALVLVVQFLLFIELFALMTLFVCVALAAVYAVGSGADKSRAIKLIPVLALSYGVASAVLAPYLYFMAASGYEPGAVHPLISYSTDLLNLFVATPTMELGRVPAFRSITSRFLGNIYEAGGYVGVPLMLLAVDFGWRNCRYGWGRWLIVIFLAAVVLSLGPFLLIGGKITIPLPGAVLAELPLLNKALPARFTLYAFLSLALITSIWLASSRTPLWIRSSAAFFIILSTLPNLSASFWTTVVDLPSFFSNEYYAKYLTPGEAVVTLPYSPMIWQLESRWYFRMVGGYVGNPPAAFRRWPILWTLYRVGPVLPDAGDQMKAFLAAHDADALLVDDNQIETWQPLLSSLNVEPVKSGGVSIYRLPSAEVKRWEDATASQMEQRACRERFNGLVLAADKYLQSGRDPNALSVAEVRRLGLLPTDWIVIPGSPQPSWIHGGINLPPSWRNQSFDEGIELKASGPNVIKVSVVGRPFALHAILDEFQRDIVEFSPSDISEVRIDSDDDRRVMMTMTFDRGGLSKAVARVHNETQTRSAKRDI